MWCDRCLRSVIEYRSCAATKTSDMIFQTFVLAVSDHYQGLSEHWGHISGWFNLRSAQWCECHKGTADRTLRLSTGMRVIPSDSWDKRGYNSTSITTSPVASWAASHTIFTRQQIWRGRQTTCWGLCVQYNHLIKKTLTEGRGGQKRIIQISNGLEENWRIISSNHASNKENKSLTIT